MYLQSTRSAATPKASEVPYNDVQLSAWSTLTARMPALDTWFPTSFRTTERLDSVRLLFFDTICAFAHATYWRTAISQFCHHCRCLPERPSSNLCFLVSCLHCSSSKPFAMGFCLQLPSPIQSRTLRIPTRWICLSQGPRTRDWYDELDELSWQYNVGPTWTARFSCTFADDRTEWLDGIILDNWIRWIRNCFFFFGQLCANFARSICSCYSMLLVSSGPLTEVPAVWTLATACGRMLQTRSLSVEHHGTPGIRKV